MKELYPWLVIAVSAFATYAWRGVGVLLSGRIDVESAVFRWVSAIAYALLAALISRMIVLPIGPMATTALADRLAAIAAAVAIFLLTRRNLLLGVAVGAAVLMLLTYLRADAVT
jgi:branched-subunit amino acid transport protein